MGQSALAATSSSAKMQASNCTTSYDVSSWVAVQVVAAVHQQRGGWDSPRLASHLERLAGKGEVGEGWQLALDMYARLGLHDRHCHMLISKVSGREPADCSLQQCSSAGPGHACSAWHSQTVSLKCVCDGVAIAEQKLACRHSRADARGALPCVHVKALFVCLCQCLGIALQCFTIQVGSSSYKSYLSMHLYYYKNSPILCIMHKVQKGGAQL